MYILKTRLRIRKGAREDASSQKMKSLKNKAEWYMSEQVTTTMSKVMTSEGMSYKTAKQILGKGRNQKGERKTQPERSNEQQGGFLSHLHVQWYEVSGKPAGTIPSTGGEPGLLQSNVKEILREEIENTENFAGDEP